MYYMEPKSLDRISTLPQPILDTILCLLTTTEEAARTSILSKDWRYKWTTIPKIELSHSMWCDSASNQISGIASSRRNINMRCKSCYDMQHILLMHQGPIHEVNFLMPVDNCMGLDPIILHLSRNHPVKKLVLGGWDICSGYKLPRSLFSFHHLTDLDIFGLDIDHPPIFNGFRSLECLCLRDVGISTKSLLHLLSNCPSLKTLILVTSYPDGECTFSELFKCLPMIEHLTTAPRVSEWLVLDSVPPELPTSLIHLKDICFEGIFRVHGYGLAFLLFLIKCSPNLEKIKLECYSDDDCEDHSIVWEEYSDVWLEHLNELEIACFSNSKDEMDFVKFILARSPKLKKLSIDTIIDGDESEISKTLLQVPHVSPVVIMFALKTV